MPSTPHRRSKAKHRNPSPRRAPSLLSLLGLSPVLWASPSLRRAAWDSRSPGLLARVSSYRVCPTAGGRLPRESRYTRWAPASCTAWTSTTASLSSTQRRPSRRSHGRARRWDRISPSSPDPGAQEEASTLLRLAQTRRAKERYLDPKQRLLSPRTTTNNRSSTRDSWVGRRRPPYRRAPRA